MIHTIWFDFTNTPHVHFLMAVQRMIQTDETEFKYSLRDFSETRLLLEQYIGSDNYHLINSTYGKTKISKVLSVFSRYNSIRKSRINYDLSVSCGSDSAIWYSRLNHKKSIAFGDNDTAKQWTYGRFVDYSFFPDAIPTEILEKQGLKGKLYQYNGFKEDIYISYYEPDRNFLNNIPFNHYIVVRPENIHANYLKNGKVKSITPELLRVLSQKGHSIVYLPRYPQDRDYCRGFSNIFIPDKPLNGLDLCYHADAVLTGAGTLAREAACLSVPSFSFYAGKQLLAVDRKLISENKIFYSREPLDLAHEVEMSSKNEPDFSRSIDVREEVKYQLLGKIKSWF